MAVGGRRFEAIWRSRGGASTLLLPMAFLFGLVTALRRALFRQGLLASERLRVPVIVVGNITVGGAGKTPLVIALVQALRAAGWSPGVLSRGYRGKASASLAWAEVDTADAAWFGDEIVLVRQRTQVPAAVAQARGRAGRELLMRHPEVDVLVCDDGLQHYALARDVEVAVFDDRGAGNARLLPAGPLREPVDRLRHIDALVFNGAIDAALAKHAPPGRSFEMRLAAQRAYQLIDPAHTAALDAFQGRSLAAVAGIAAPPRFFAMLAAAGLAFTEVPLADHYDYLTDPFSALSEEVILVTEKDAVKCGQLVDPRIWVVPVDAVLEESFYALVLEKIRGRK